MFVSRYSYRQPRNGPVLPIMKHVTEEYPNDFSQGMTSVSLSEYPPFS